MFYYQLKPQKIKTFRAIVIDKIASTILNLNSGFVHRQIQSFIISQKLWISIGRLALVSSFSALNNAQSGI